MEFRKVKNIPDKSEKNTVYLVKDGWNDWFYWETLFTMFYSNDSGELSKIGYTKIADKDMKASSSLSEEEKGEPFYTPDLPDTFPYLDESFFSLGQSENFYETLNQITGNTRVEILKGIRDCAYNLEIFENYKSHPAMRDSLLRDISERNVKESLHAIAYEEDHNRPFNFSYLFPTKDVNEHEIRLEFSVDNKDMPQSNIQAIIGRNGVGKTTLFSGFIKGVIKLDTDNENPVGSLQVKEHVEWEDNSTYFNSLNLCSYSPFDRFGPVGVNNLPSGVKYQYIGLMVLDQRGDNNENKLRPKSSDELHAEFCKSMQECLIGVRRNRWEECLNILENDPLFSEAGVSKLAQFEDKDYSKNWREVVKKFLNKLSSGHLVTLLSITKLVEVTEDRSLTLIDEPEAHLHPPLISAYIRAVSHLMSERNGVAIVATHSPVVLQEVRSDCVWILNRTGQYVSADRPQIETFGENVGTLTREVFSHEVVNTGFYKMIADACEKFSTFDEVNNYFSNKLGGEARALVRSLVNKKKRDSDD
ncbi:MULTISPECIES: AAA family ATPase [Pantoea]|uniref:AAA family ATPase n=1 Tax=Pantoea TaxID=53335 RepID=UPI00045D05D4|nr:AAA family ATPase [Pantoea agglomerans]KDA94263.1 hypothetical protein T296_11710 [Pantoea agglomerans Eh318]NQS79424.1 ATP-binding protein [Pantoea agglomerans]